MFPATHRQGHGHGHGLLAKGTNGNLSLVWIAATLGPKAHLKRISKREIVSLNVPAACRLIAEPTPGGETLPLRISSTLLSGVSRVYGQQYNLHFNNVINVIDQIRLHLSSKRPTEITLEQPKISDEHRIETITLPLYPDIDLFGPATTLDLPAFLPPLTPIAPAAFPEEFLPGPAPGGAAPPAYRAGTPSMELGRGYEPSGIGMGMTSDLSTSDLGGYAGGYVFPESARAGAAGLESPSFISSTRTSLSSRRVSGLRATGAGAVPTISELAMAAEREHGIMDLDLGLDLPPLPAGQEEIGRPLGFGRMSPLLQALPSLSPEPGARPQPMFGEPMIPPPMIEEEHPTPAVFHEEDEEPLQDLEPIPKRRRVAGPRHPRLDQMTELPAAYWRNPPIVPHAALVRPPTPTRDQVMDCVFGPLIADIDEEFADMGRVGMFARQQVRLEHEELAPGLARVPPAPPEAEQLSYPAYAERIFTPEPETRRARSVSAELGHPGDVSTEQYRPPYAFGIEDLTAEPHEPPTRLPSDLESPGRVGGFVLPISPIMEPGLTSDISSMAGGPEPQLLFPPSPMLAPMRELTEEPADISTTHYASAMQQQSLNFYQRTKVLLEASATGELAFVDMLPARTRVVAAQAFYHLLTLVTQGKFKVHQEAPYEVIHVTGVDHDEDEDVEEM